jgi:solute carrier family 25 phosphate transporter 23/24/25/41
MKNADEMLKRIMEEVDKNNDGKIQYNGTHICLP